MTVGELKIELQKYPDTMDVFIDERSTEFRYGLLNGVSVRDVSFSEESDNGKELCKEKCVILSED